MASLVGNKKSEKKSRRERNAGDSSTRNWFDRVTGTTSNQRDTYRKNKAAVGGATLNQSNLDAAAAGGVLYKDRSGDTVRRAGTITIDSNNNIVDVVRETPRGAGAGNRYVGTAPNPTGGRPRANIVTPVGLDVVHTPPDGAYEIPGEYFGEHPGYLMPEGWVHLPTAETMGTTPIYWDGHEMPRHPGFSDAAAWQERYGEAELIETGVGLTLMYQDFMWGVAEESARKATEGTGVTMDDLAEKGRTQWQEWGDAVNALRDGWNDGDPENGEGFLGLW